MRRRPAALTAVVLLTSALAAVPPATAVTTDRAPTARNDPLTTFEDTKITYTAPGVLSNDTDPERRQLTARMVRKPRHGTARLSRSGRLVYTPDRNWSGRDRIVYVAVDPSGQRDRATVVIRVKAVNDAPRLIMRLETPVKEYSTSRVTLDARDPEGDAITYKFDCDGDGGFEVSQGTKAYDCLFGDEGEGVVRGRVVDAKGARSTAQIAVTVQNQRPVVTIADTSSGGPAGQSIPVDLGSFDDPGADDGPWTVTVDWGDGTSTVLDPFEEPGAIGTVAHTWATPGDYFIDVSVAEEGGATGSLFTFIQISQPPPPVTD